MKQKKILHVLAPDKFTIPFIQFINHEFDHKDHLFLIIKRTDENLLLSANNISFLSSPFRFHFFKNLLIFYKSIIISSKIILHGNPVIFYFALFPWILKKTYWIINGYELEFPNLDAHNKNSKLFHSYVKNFVLKRVYGHITHIKGDSELANFQFKSSAKFYYSPMYLSNVVSIFKPEEFLSLNESQCKKILVGNSTCPTNNHISIFKMLLPFREENILIYCPLSYGNYIKYRDEIIRTGKDLFLDKFVPITNFMNLIDYNNFLGEIDIAVFNHYRQEAMGITLTLLNMGKVVYMNSGTTSYHSFIDRGIKVFDNALIEKEGLFVKRDVSVNPALVFKDYSIERFVSSLSAIFND